MKKMREGRRDVLAEQGTHVTTITDRIKQINMKRMQAQDQGLGEIEKDSVDMVHEIEDNNEPDENIRATQETRVKTKRVDDAKENFTLDESETLENVSQLAQKIKHLRNVNLNRKEEAQLRKIEDRLQKLLERKLLGPESIQSDSSEETSPAQSSGLCSDTDDSDAVVKATADMSTMGGESLAEFDTGHRFQMTVDVHQEAALDDEDQLQGAVGGVIEDPFCDTVSGVLFLEEENRLFSTKQVSHEMYSDSSQEDDHSENSRKLKGLFQRKEGMNKMKMLKFKQGKIARTKHQPIKEVRWGEEESSDSEGGWDFETGGMPLLPR